MCREYPKDEEINIEIGIVQLVESEGVNALIAAGMQRDGGGV